MHPDHLLEDSHHRRVLQSQIHQQQCVCRGCGRVCRRELRRNQGPVNCESSNMNRKNITHLNVCQSIPLYGCNTTSFVELDLPHPTQV